MGHDLTSALIDLAYKRSISRIYLLTETAKDFFPRFGFKPVSRTEVPEAVKQSVEFTSACPVMALVMVLTLEKNPHPVEYHECDQPTRAL
jgi:amino-acid N-acetyltransferase